MGKKKRRRRKPTAHPERMKQLAADILAGTVSGLIVLAIQKLLEGYKALKEANIIGADKWFHCLYMCKATRESKSPNLVLSLGVLREIVDLLKGRFKGAVDSKTGKKLEEIEHALDSLEDMKANRKGIDCPPEKTCECCCNEYKVNGL